MDRQQVLHQEGKQVENLVTEAALRARVAPARVQLYGRYFDALWECASEGDDARALLVRILESFVHAL
jgi:hypothetical protein